MAGPKTAVPAPPSGVIPERWPQTTYARFYPRSTVVRARMVFASSRTSALGVIPARSRSPHLRNLVRSALRDIPELDVILGGRGGSSSRCGWQLTNVRRQFEDVIVGIAEVHRQRAPVILVPERDAVLSQALLCSLEIVHDERDVPETGDSGSRAGDVRSA